MRAFGQNDSSGPRGRQGRQPGPWCPGRCCRGVACSAAAARITPGLDHDTTPPDTHRQSSYTVLLYSFLYKQYFILFLKAFFNDIFTVLFILYFYTNFLYEIQHFRLIFCPKCSIFND